MEGGSNNIARIGLSVEALEDLQRSGLVPEDIGARAIGGAELAATGTPSIGGRPPLGYAIPYFDMDGTPVPFYRLKLLEARTVDDDVKYRQPKGSQNYIYFPRGFKKLFREAATVKGYCLITEGEKKAACAAKMGFLCAAVAGVDSWRTRRIILPKDTQLEQSQTTGMITAKIPQGTANDVVQDSSALAVGLHNLMDALVKYGMTIIIVYDSDEDGGTKIEVQRAAAMLGYEFRYQGLPIDRIRQLVLPARGKKVGLDDFLLARGGGSEELNRLIKSTMNKRTAFPQHPNPRAYINGRLQKKQLSRKEAQDVSFSVLAELESRGRRFRTAGADDLHYFDETLHTLFPVQLNNQRIPLHETSFGAYLYHTYGLGGADKRIVEWLATQFTGEPTVYVTETHKVLARMKGDAFRDCVSYQLSDSHYVIITPDPDNPFVMCENGTNGILFEQGQVDPMDIKELETQFFRYLDAPPKMLWHEILSQLKVKPHYGEGDEPKATAEQMMTLASLLHYISPWLLRWRNTQLPIELTIGEAGSGKSSVLSLRQRILTGRPYLANMTGDIKDWYAGITARGGVYVSDNVHFTAKKAEFRQQLSDEICRLITEPEPHVEMRKLYTTNQIMSLPVRCTFAMTSIEQPFFNVDLLQRAMILELDAIQRSHDSDWVPRQLALAGGRVGWIAHHLAAIHKFLYNCVYKEEWNPQYHAHHRLANYEQCLIQMGNVFGVETDWIPEALAFTVEGQVNEADWIHRALRGFVHAQKEEHPTDYFMKRWAVQDICNWMEQHEEFSKNSAVTNSWKLGRYLQSHKAQIESTIKLRQEGKRANRFMYGILRHSN